MQLTRPRRRATPSCGGFTLIEILVTVAVVAIGLLGLAKMQAAAVSETQTARTRSLIAMQAESLASAMRANRALWADATAATKPGFSMDSAGAVTYVGGTTATKAGGCTAAASLCTPGQLAHEDILLWTNAFKAQFPGSTASLTCAGTGPVSCDLSLSWTERVVAVNRTTAAASAARTNTNYMFIHVQP